MKRVISMNWRRSSIYCQNTLRIYQEYNVNSIGEGYTLGRYVLHNKLCNTLKGISLIKLALLICVFFNCQIYAHGKTIKTQWETIVIFDAKDRVIGLDKIYVLPGCILSKNKNFKYKLIEVTNKGIVVHRSSSSSPNAQLVVIIATRKKKSWVPTYSWSNFRIFSRPFISCTPSRWSLLDESDIYRSPSLVINHTETNSSTRLWGYQIPVFAIGNKGVEMFVCRRPIWQTSYAKEYIITEKSNTVKEFVVSHPTQTFNTYPERFNVIPKGQSAIRYIANVPVIDGKAHFYFIPSEPISNGDAVTIFSRDNVEPLPTSSFNNTETSISQYKNAFISVVIRSTNQPQRSTQLVISVGGMDRFSQKSKSFSYSIVFQDGTTIKANNVDSRRPSLQLWPSHIPLNQAIFFATGSINEFNNKVFLKEFSYTIVPADEAFVGDVKAYAERHMNNKSPMQTINSGGVFKLRLR